MYFIVLNNRKHNIITSQSFLGTIVASSSGIFSILLATMDSKSWSLLDPHDGAVEVLVAYGLASRLKCRDSLKKIRGIKISPPVMFLIL
jgi:hypothetical protein